MTVTVDPRSLDVSECDGEVPSIREWLAVLWGAGPAGSSPAPPPDGVPAGSLAAAGWRTALWGFAI